MFNAVQMQTVISHKVKFRWIRSLQLYSTMRLRRVKGGRERILNFVGDPRNVDEGNFWCEVDADEVIKPATEAEEDQGQA